MKIKTLRSWARQHNMKLVCKRFYPGQSQASLVANDGYCFHLCTMHDYATTEIESDIYGTNTQISSDEAALELYEKAVKCLDDNGSLIAIRTDCFGNNFNA